MNNAKALWGSVMGNPVLMRRLNGWMALIWVAMIPVSFFMGWLNSVIYVSALSLWALVSGHWSAWQAARVEVKQEEEAQKDLPGEIVRRVVTETEIEPSTGPGAP